MRKNRIVALCIMGTIFISGCGAVDAIKEDAKEQIEWTEENNARTNGMSAEEAVENVIEDLTGEDVNITGGADSVSDADIYYIGDTAPMKLSDGDVSASLDVTVTGYKQVCDSAGKNITAIYYTVASKDGDQVQFGNPYFTVYADSSYVESGVWENYTPYSYGMLRPGTTYDGCYVADVDPFTVNEIEIYCGESAWIIQEGAMQVIETPAFDPMAYMEYSGGYSGDFGSASVSFYSSVEDDYVGNASITFTDGTAYSGDFSYNPDTYTFELVEDDGTTISLHFSIEGDSYYLSVWDITNGASNYLASFMLTERYES